MNPNPMRILALFLLITGVLRAAEEIPYLAREYDASKWPEVPLKIDQAGTLKNVFDAGLRPYRYPGLESSFLEVKHIRLRVHLASGKQLPVLNVEKMEITPFDDGEISTIEGFGPKLGLESAKIEMLAWLPYSTHTDEELDSYLQAVESNHLEFDDPYRGRPDGLAVSWKEPGWKEKGGGPHCTIWFRKTASQTNPLRLHFKMSWSLNRPSKARKAYNIPIPPPPGYENVTMEAPENFGPDSATDILKAKGVDVSGGVDTTKRDEHTPMNGSGRASDTAQINSENEKHRPLLWFIGTALLVIAILVGISGKRRRST